MSDNRAYIGIIAGYIGIYCHICNRVSTTPLAGGFWGAEPPEWSFAPPYAPRPSSKIIFSESNRFYRYSFKYPAETPVWSLQNEDGTSGTLSNFDATLHRIECHVNEGLDKFVRQDVETTYDFILVHQLADIVACWDEVMSANEGGGSSWKGRGEDQLAAFGERSPFFW